MSVAVKKLDGVESVEVSLEKASADIRLRADNRLTLEQLRQVIRQAGHPTKDVEITARGMFVEHRGKPAFDLLNGARIELDERPAFAGAAIVEVTGVCRAQKKGADRLIASTIKIVGTPRAERPESPELARKPGRGR